MDIVDEPLVKEPREPWGFEGLLIFVGLGVLLSPFKIISGFVSTYPPLFTDGTWDSITSMNSMNYDPYWGTLITVEIIANSVFIFLSVYLLYLFFKKKANFPKWYFIVATSSIAFTLIDSYVVSWIYPTVEMVTDELISGLVPSLVSLLVWSPYLFKSERSKNTFVL